MTIAHALQALRKSGIPDEQMALAAGVGAQQVGRWRKGLAEPRASQYQRLRIAFPHFADLVDGKAVA